MNPPLEIPSPLRSRFAGSLGTGFLFALAFPPYELPVTIPLAFALQYLLMRHADPWPTAVSGMAFGVSFYLFHTYWFSAFQPMVFPVILLGLGLLTGAWGLGLGLVGVNPWSTTAGWILLKLFLEHFYLAFPWSRIASALASYPGLIQPVALLGEVGWEALIVLVVLLLTEGLLEQRRRTLVAGFLVLSIVLGLLVWGYARLTTVKVEPLDQRFVLVQPNVPLSWQQHDRESYRTRLSKRLISLSQNQSRPSDVLVWPEASVLGNPLTFGANGPEIRRNGGWPDYFKSVLDSNNRLLFGTLSRSPHPRKLDGLNLAVLLDNNTQILGYYTKQMPVPLAERIPFMERSRPLKHLGQWLGTTGIRPGRNGGLIPLELENRSIQLGIQICFEDSFGHYVKNQVHRGADVLVNLSNDGWSGSRGLHEQHFSRSIVRAVETGRSLLRVGTTGVSAIVTPLGRPVKRLDSHRRGVVKGRAYEPLGPTVYVRWSHLITPFLFLLLAGMGSVERYRQKLASPDGTETE